MMPHQLSSQSFRFKRKVVFAIIAAFLLLLSSGYIYILQTIVHLEKSLLASNLPGGLIRVGQRQPLSVATEVDSKSITWEWDVVHTINTRFMQNQPSLPMLARARFKLFKEFCFPTIVNQTSQKFLWIVKVDPRLDGDIILELTNLLQPYPNFFVVGSNKNFLSGKGSQDGSWRGGEEGREILSSTIYSGDVSLLRGALKAESKQIVLETRLDADDGLTNKFVENIQESATHRFISSSIRSDTNKVRWRYWCIRYHIEWYADGHEYGEVTPIEHNHFCVTPGLTTGFGVGTEYSSVMQAAHDILFKQVWNKGDCGLGRGKNCVEMLSDKGMDAVRTRTPTSAGMLDIDLVYKLSDNKSKMLWETLIDSFSISKKGAYEANSYIHSNMESIALENAMGQCSKGHSCKIKSKEKLLRLQEIDKYDKMLEKVTN